MKEWKEIIIIKDKNLVINLEVKIKDNSFYYTLSNDNTKVSINADSYNIEEAKKEFSDFVIALLKHWNDKNRLELMFDINEINWDIDINNIDTVQEIEQKKN